MIRNICSIIILGLLLSSCVTYGDVRVANRENIKKLQIGNSSAQVTQTMGNLVNNDGVEKIYGLYKTEALNHNNKNYTVWYYYTDRIGDNNWENGMTPIIFLNDSVVGIGWRSMEKLGLDSKSSTIRLK
jgi:hypothetical protein